MSEGLLTAVIGGGAVVAVALLQALMQLPARLRDPRKDVQRDLDLVAKLSPDSRVRARLLADVEQRIDALIAHDASRNWVGVFLGLALLGALGLGTWRFALWGGWWWPLAVLLGLLAIVMAGIIRDDFAKVPRTRTGRAIARDQVPKPASSSE